MDPRIAKELSKEDQTPFHKQILSDTKALVSISRRKMMEYWPRWDQSDEVFRGVRERDRADIAAWERGEPEKMVVPLSYAQVQTFVAFCYSLYTQRDRLFELVGFTPEDERPAKVGEALLARDLRWNRFEAKLMQFLLDVARFGIGIMKVSWTRETAKGTVRGEESPPVEYLGTRLGSLMPPETEGEVVRYEGNVITNISPYRFFPDVRLPLSRYQEGEFVASEDLYSYSQLKQWQVDGEVAGIEHIPPIGKDIAVDRGYRWDTGLDPGCALTVGAGIRGDGQSKKPIIITEVQRTLIPAEYEVEGEPLGPEDYPVKYLIWMANDQRIIKCEPLAYAHNEYTYAVAPFIYDNNQFMPFGLSEVIDRLQDVITWLINARITNVRKVISNYLVVDPNMINMEDLQQRKPVIRLKAAAAGGVDRYIKQLVVQDVTQSHITDARFLQEVMQIVTGVNDTILGQFQPGRRSATEHRNVASGAAARLRTVAEVVWYLALEPMARQMLSNLREGLESETFVRLLGTKADPSFIQVSKRDLIGRYDFEVFNGSLPSERHYTAQVLSELFQTLMRSPDAAMFFGVDPKKLLFEILRLRGVKNPEQYATGTPTTTTGPAGPTPGVQGTVEQPILSPLARLAVQGGAGGD